MTHPRGSAVHDQHHGRLAEVTHNPTERITDARTRLARRRNLP